MEEKRVTIKEIAEALSVSPTTVTKALTGKAQVSDKKRALIVKTAEEMGYKPNKFARALVRGELKFGIVVPRMPAEFMRYLNEGIARGLNEYADYKVKGLFHYFPDNTAVGQVEEALQAAVEEGIDGLIFAPGFGSEAYRDMLCGIASKIPVVLFGQEMTDTGSVATIHTDSDALGRIAAQMLSIALPSGGEAAIVTTSRRFTGHQRVIEGFMCENEQNGGLAIRAVAENYDSAEQSYARAQELLEAHPGIQGIYVTSYNYLPVCRRLKECGRTDIAVVGHDLYPEMIPALTEGPLLAALYQNPILQGQMAVRTLYEAVTEKKKPGEIVVKPEIVLRSNLECYRSVY